jgi:hypothetical protein
MQIIGDQSGDLLSAASRFKAADPDNDLKELDSPAGQALLKLIYK